MATAANIAARRAMVRLILDIRSEVKRLDACSRTCERTASNTLERAYARRAHEHRLRVGGYAFGGGGSGVVMRDAGVRDTSSECALRNDGDGPSVTTTWMLSVEHPLATQHDVSSSQPSCEGAGSCSGTPCDA